ncbi:hypothetical protein LCGC14_2240020, partial [marine sediment metagenome]
RLDNIASAASPTDAQKYVAYTYLGAATIVKLVYPDVFDNGTDDRPLTLTYDPDRDSTHGSLDRFNRVADQHWRHEKTAGTVGATQDQYTYGYDYNSNRLWRQNTQETMLGELYHANEAPLAAAYDGLDRLKDFRRGTLSKSQNGDHDYDEVTDDIDLVQDFGLDPLGNWRTFKEDADGTDWDLEQEREHNKANEIDDSDASSGDQDDNAIEATTGVDWKGPEYNIGAEPSTNTWTPGYDKAGNMLSGPETGSEGTATKRQFYEYDAWNRLSKVTADSDGDGRVSDEPAGSVLADYYYDGLHRRIRKTVDPGGDDIDFDYYYSLAWQVLEVRREASAYPHKQYVWGARYIDAPIVRFRDGDLATAPDETIDDILYYMQDANFNVTGLVKETSTDVWEVVERYMYDPYGKVTVLDGAEDNDGTDTSETEWAERAAADSFENEILYCGYRYDLETKLYHVRFRMHHPTLGRWLQRDPLGHVEGMNLYEYCGGMPVRLVDPYGLWEGPIDMAVHAYQQLFWDVADARRALEAAKRAAAQRRHAATLIALAVAEQSLYDAAGRTSAHLAWQTSRGAVQGWRMGHELVFNNMTLGATNALGLTDTEAIKYRE